MQKRKKGIIIASAVIVGILGVSGTAYGYTKNTETSIKNEQSSLSSIKSAVAKMVDKSGYLTSTATLQKLNNYRNTVNKMKDSNVDFRIKKADLKNELRVIRIDKKDVLNRIGSIENKISIQNGVNALFTDAVINGSEVTNQPVLSTVTLDQINRVKASIDSKDTSKWASSLNSLVNDATAQINQITKAQQLVSKLIKDGTVQPDANRTSYNQALTEVNKIKNPDVKKSLTDQLNKVLGVVKANEEKAKEEQAKLEQAKLEQAKKAEQAQTSSTSRGSSNSVSSTSRSSSKTSSSSNKSSSSSSKTSNSHSSSTSKSSSSSSKPSASKSSSSSSSSKTSGSNDSSTSKTIQGTQTGSGKISGTDSTYTTGTFNDTGDIPWDSLD